MKNLAARFAIMGLRSKNMTFVNKLPELLDEYEIVLSDELFNVEKYYDVRSAIASEFLANDAVFDYGRLIDDALKNRQIINDKVHLLLPPLLEVIEETIKRDLIIKSIVGRLSPYAYAVVINGSSNWGRYYSVSKNSDIDIDVIFDKYSDFLCLDDDNLVGEMNTFYRLFEGGLADMLMSKIEINGIKVSLHFIPKEKFDYIIGYDFEFSCIPFSLRAYRTKLSEKPSQQYGPTYNFIHKPYYYDLAPAKVDNGFMTGQPFMMVGDDGEFVFAISLHKLILFGSIHSNFADEITIHFLNILHKISVRRKRESQFSDIDATFRLSVAKYEKMPRFIQDKVDSIDCV